LKRVLRAAALLIVLGDAGGALAQRLLCTQLPPAERERARTAGQCRDPAPIIDVVPTQRVPDAADSPISPQIAPNVRPGSGSGGTLPVPNVVGMSFDEARNRLTRFTVQRSYRAAAEAGGTVLAQAPMAPANIVAGAPVSLVLSDGSLVRVPRVTNVNINDARQRLQKDLDLKAQPVVITSDQRVGTVIEQQPAEGTLVKRGSVVRLQVSAGQEGPTLLDVPNVVGLSFDVAKTRLARFAIERTEQPRSGAANDLPEGQVVEQTPRPPARAAAGSVVVLKVSSAPRAAIEVFEMPNVVGRSYQDAARVLSEFKVSRTEKESESPRDQVLEQTPAAGSALSPGATVTLKVAVGPAVPSAPAVKGNATPAEPEFKSDTDVLTGVLAISAAVVLGLIVGGLVMRQFLLRQRAVSAADDAVTSLSDLPAQGITSVDILLEDQAASAPATETRHVVNQAPGPSGEVLIAGDSQEAVRNANSENNLNKGDVGSESDEGKGQGS